MSFYVLNFRKKLCLIHIVNSALQQSTLRILVNVLKMFHYHFYTDYAQNEYT